METIEVQEIDDGKIKFSTQQSFEVLIRGDRYEELQLYADSEQISESEALAAMIQRGLNEV